MIKIENLNQRQRELLDIMLTIEEFDELKEWATSLTLEDANEVIVLIELIKHELVEEILAKLDEFKDALIVIKNIKDKK